MNKLISKCPACHGALQITTLRCPDCGMELRNVFDISAFDLLDSDQLEFLTAFLRNRGNMKEVQSDMQISYPAAKKKLDNLLEALNLGGAANDAFPKEPDVSCMNVDYTSNLASEIIKAKLKEHGGHVTVYTARGLPCEIYAEPDGTTFTSDKLRLSLRMIIRCLTLLLICFTDRAAAPKKETAETASSEKRVVRKTPWSER